MFVGNVCESECEGKGGVGVRAGEKEGRREGSEREGRREGCERVRRREGRIGYLHILEVRNKSIHLMVSPINKGSDELE